MTVNSRTSKSLFICAALAVWPLSLCGQNQGLVAKWSFEDPTGAIAHNSVSGADDNVEGLYLHVPGASGKGLRFDGYSTSVVSKAANVSKLGNAFTIEA